MKNANPQAEIKAVLFDLDGLVIVGRSHVFSQRLSEERDIPREDIEAFFHNEFKDCSYGRADLKEKIAPYLPKWKWRGTVEQLLQYWFESESTKDERILEIITKLRAKGIKCYIATRQEKYRMNYLLNEVGLKNYFDGTFCTYDIGYDKSQPEFFERVLNDLRLESKHVLFFDDKEVNVECALSLGINAYYYEGFQTLKKQADLLLTDLIHMPTIDKLAWFEIKDKKMLFVRTKGKDLFYTPGGKREAGESDQQALARELQEELHISLVSETIRYVHTFTDQAHDKPEGVLVEIKAYTAQYQGTITPSAEIEEVIWLSSQDADKLSSIGRRILQWLKIENLID